MAASNFGKGKGAMELNQLATEQRNEKTAHIDSLSTLEMMRVINEEDCRVAPAVGKELVHIAEAVDAIAARMKKGGRLIYVGAGTSGRLGILDASECPPTYSAEPEQVIGLIAGGREAMFQAVEGAEDSPELGRKALEELRLTAGDAVVGIAASGRTPYVLGAMNYAREKGAFVISLACTKPSRIEQLADIAIAPLPGPEVITGSTRMKSGTAQKLVLNMLSTGTMIKLGKVYGNLMVDVKPSNEKLIARCKSIVEQATGVDEETAQKALEACHYHPKTAIVMLLLGKNREEAEALLQKAEGHVAACLAKKP